MKRLSERRSHTFHELCEVVSWKRIFSVIYAWRRGTWGCHGWDGIEQKTEAVPQLDEKPDEMNPAQAMSEIGGLCRPSTQSPSVSQCSLQYNMAVPPGELVMLQELANNPAAFRGKSIRATGM